MILISWIHNWIK